MVERKINAAAVSELEDGDTSFPGGSDQSQALVTRRASAAIGEVAGETQNSDLRIPRLQTAYGVGKFMGKFAPGSLILGEDNLLASINEPVRVIVLSAETYWKEYLSGAAWDAGRRDPATYTSEAEVLKAGGTTQWGPKGSPPPTFSQAMDLKLFVQKPKTTICGLFGIEMGGETWAPALWTVDKSAYKRVGPVVISTCQFALRARGLLSGLFEIKYIVEKVNNKPTIVPNIKLVGHNNDDIINGIKELFGIAKS